MRQRRLFVASTLALALLFLAYGAKRFTLGIDFTDEGAYAAWPLRMLFGEKLFASELGTLLRPLAAHLFVLFKVAPDLTLYQLRLIGWALHVAAFVGLSAAAFKVSERPILSPLLAAIPLFVCHLFGLATPSYNNVSSDFFTLALSLRLLGAQADSRHPVRWQVGAGVALFLATLAHPVLGVAAGMLLIVEVFPGGLLGRLARGRPTPVQVGLLVFVGLWAMFACYLLASGAATVWLARIRLFQSFTVTSLESHPFHSWVLVMAYPFASSRVFISATVLALLTAAWLRFSPRDRHAFSRQLVGATLPLLLLFYLVEGFSFRTDHLPVYFAMVAVIAAGFAAGRGPAPERPLLLASILAAMLYGTVTFYFSPLRSWSSGMLGLPFAFAVGLGVLLKPEAPRSAALFRLLAGILAGLLVACVAREHYRSIYRDARPAELTALTRVPALAHLRTTPERAAALDELYDFLGPKLHRGEPLLVYDECPLLYFVFAARPVYGLAWATRYTQSPGALAQLDRELRAGPLPRYAVRLLVDPAQPHWADAPRLTYADYPLNQTVERNYHLERTIFPFEIWRRNDAAP